MDPIDTLLTRGVDTIYPSKKAFEKVLRSGKKLTLYQGFDPTGTQLHIGHSVAIRKLRQFQDLGHQVIFLIGDGTGQAGDPSGKTKARDRFHSREELRKNARDYVTQAGKIVRFEGKNPVKILYNGDWLNKLTLVDILEIAQNFSVQQLIERDMYQERMKKGDSINLREFLYPLLQGYDSVAMEVDLELGGTDQTFNMLAGRTLVKNMLGKEKFVMTVPLLADAKGTKIGKTEGNVIGITDTPSDFYAKIMSLGDEAIIPCFTLLTDTREEDIQTMKRAMKGGENPMTYKKQLAHALTAQFNTKKDADSAQAEFERVVQKGERGKHLQTTPTNAFASGATIVDAIVSAKLVSSKAQAKRLVQQGAVEYNSTVIDDPRYVPKGKPGDILRIGKKTRRELT